MSTTKDTQEEAKYYEIEKILISRERYEGLLHNEQFLSLLEAHGVDNWEGYRLALRGLEPKSHHE